MGFCVSHAQTYAYMRSQLYIHIQYIHVYMHTCIYIHAYWTYIISLITIIIFIIIISLLSEVFYGPNQYLYS